MADIDTIQSALYERLLFLPISYPNYAVRLEVGAAPLSSDVFKKALYWLEKLQDMDDSIFLKSYFNRLKKLAKKDGTLVK